jgi:nitroimidazol reductase NimA-like FMN-containing flavoprotein (pyridoxamine 5'-phosphate oxidase superfamily)
MMRRRDREITDRDELIAMLEGSDSCRLAFAAGGTPYIVTLNFGYEWEGEFPLLFFHCAHEGRKLEMMRANPRVCFELDLRHELSTGPSPCDWGMKFESIVGYGILSEPLDDQERRRGLDQVMRHYGWSGEMAYNEGALNATTVLKLEVGEMSGKRKA